MNPDAPSLWRGPRWSLALLLAGLGTLGPFSIDTYLPAFDGIARTLGATPLQMQQTLSAYLFGFAALNLFHGALADSFGRRPVVLWGLALFTLASLGCALAPSIGALVGFRALQGMAAGAGMIVSRAIIRDMFPPADAQRVMSQVTIYFGIAPAVAPMVGGFLFVHADWHSIFWFLTAVGALLWGFNWRRLPETLHATQRQPFDARHLLRGYWSLGANARFVALCFASGVPFNGMFLYVLSAPAWLGGQLGLAPTQFFWFFCLSIGGIMLGAWLSGRLAGQVAPERQIRRGFNLMFTATLLNLALNATLDIAGPHAWAWALPPVALFSFGWALMVPVVTIKVLDLAPDRRGMASSLQAFVGSVANGLVAGIVSPLVMRSNLGLAITSAAFLGIGLAAWQWVKRQAP
ncbi:MAG TPA: multidrug effflux MFS transporter [Burkholderiaceae bacterium]|nr:multidrug effflux MFS transporter [Burkholderiaceae bacterium]